MLRGGQGPLNRNLSDNFIMNFAIHNSFEKSAIFLMEVKEGTGTVSGSQVKWPFPFQ